MDKDNSKSSKNDEYRTPADSFQEIKSEEDEIDLLELLGILWVHKWWITGITGFATVAALVYVIFSSSTFLAGRENVRTYTSTAVVLVNEASGAGIPFSMYEGLFDISSLKNSTSFLISYGPLAEKLLNEKSMLRELEEENNLSGDGLFVGNMETMYDKATGLLRISYTSNDPVKSKEAVAGAYKLIQTKFESFVTDYAMEERKILEKKLEETRKEFLNVEYRIRRFQIDHGLSGASDAEFTKNLLKEEFELYTDMKLDREISRDLIDYLPRPILFISLKDEIELPIFQLIAGPELPVADIDSGMSGKVIIAVVIMAAFFLSIFFVFIINAVKNIRSNPERMKKLKGIK